MCGACGTGQVRAPWEAAAGSGPRDLLARARALQTLLAGLRWRVAPWGPSGFTVTRPTGGTLVAPDLDTVTAAALRAGWVPPATTGSSPGDPAADLVLASARRVLSRAAG
ncbi:hypothetical protein [Kineococcus rhizosphaerae]|uniref:Uncharacterized protein n=1 Tax=Kineococcus rhizosphaerae TaxID=559628 RepID=A0A2T0R0F5_9ACTN|nr:hypothetical protein [Kineococcus rhizosphaerae]PRY12619.1 hypothetical protein CLV37_110179 [Kineococcus rhizosphaerae]